MAQLPELHNSCTVCHGVAKILLAVSPLFIIPFVCNGLEKQSHYLSIQRFGLSDGHGCQ